MENKIELYIHIPFCARKCNYCDFLSFCGNREEQKAYVQALCREIEEWDGFASSSVSTVFIGGGTPSILPAEDIGKIFHTLKKTMGTSYGKPEEVSIECNPGTVDEEKLLAYREYGINRISFGLQSADNDQLKLLGRIHTWEEFLCSYELARNAGFDNINVDLMSALPGQSVKSWEQTLKKTAALRPEHISAYSLMIEEGTPFFERYRAAEEIREKGDFQKILPTEEDERKMYDETERILSDMGYRQYEISNYAREGKQCRHNCGYWTGVPYKGFGLGASSYLNHERLMNTESFSEYLSDGAGTQCIQRLSKQDEMEETMILGMRMIQGVDRKEFRKKYGTEPEDVYGKVIEKYVKMKFLIQDEKGIRFSKNGISVSNVILSDFLF